MHRRTFISTSCSACGLALTGTLASWLTSCAAMPAVLAESQGNELRIPLDSFADQKTVRVKHPSLEHEVLAVKNEDLSYHALYLNCTHQQNPLVPAGNRIYCNAHGSTFDLKGRVIKEPATEPLVRPGTRVENNYLYITP